MTMPFSAYATLSEKLPVKGKTDVTNVKPAKKKIKR